MLITLRVKISSQIIMNMNPWQLTKRMHVANIRKYWIQENGIDNVSCSEIFGISSCIKKKMIHCWRWEVATAIPHHYFFCFEFWNSTITWFYYHLPRCRLKLQNNSLSNKKLKDVLVDVFFTFPSQYLKAKDWRPLDDVAVASTRKLRAMVFFW